VHRGETYNVCLTADKKEIRTVSQISAWTLGFEQQLRSLEYGAVLAGYLDHKLVRSIGRRLFKFLFDGPAGDLYFEYKRDIAENGPIAIAVAIDSADTPELLDLPWEAIHDGESFVVANKGIEFLRTGVHSDRKSDFSADRALRLLVATSTPRDLAQHELLDVEHEVQILMSILAEPVRRGQISIQFVDGVNAEELAGKVGASEPDIIHFIGHGYHDRIRQRSGLIFEDKAGQLAEVSNERVTESLTARFLPMLVILNACNTATCLASVGRTGLAWQLVAAGVPSVVAMRSAITDNDAVAFTGSFYKALLAGLTVSEALADARLSFVRGARFLPGFLVPLLVQASPEPVSFGVLAERPPAEVEAGYAIVGRNGEIVALQRAIASRRRPLMCLVGPKGVGKSHLLQAVGVAFLRRNTFSSSVTISTGLEDALADVQDTLARSPRPCLLHVELDADAVVPASLLEPLEAVVEPGDCLIVEGPICPPVPLNVGYFMVPGLSRSATLELVLNIVPGFPPLTATRLANLCGGNPGIALALKSVVERGDDLDDNALYAVLYRFGLLARLEKLDAPHTMLLEQLAMFRVPLVRPLLGAIIKLPDLSRALDLMVSEGWLAPVSITNPDVLTVPPWLRNFILRDLSKDVRKQFHLNAAGYFEQCMEVSEVPDAYISEEVNHLESAGEVARAIAVRSILIERQLRHNPDQALEGCERLLKAIELIGPPSARLLMETQVELLRGQAMERLSLEHAACRAFEQVIRLADSHIDAEISDPARTQLMRLKADAFKGLAELELIQGRHDKATVHLERALETAGTYGDHPSAVGRYHLRLAQLAIKRRDRNGFDQHINAAVQGAQSDGDPILEAEAMLFLASGIEDSAAPNPSIQDRRLEYLEQALVVARLSGDMNICADAAIALAIEFMKMGRNLPRVAALAQDALEKFKQLKHFYGIATCEALLGNLHLHAGELPQAAPRFTAAASGFREAGFMKEAAEEKATCIRMLPELFRLGQVFLKEGNLGLAENYAKAALDLSKDLGDGNHIDEAEVDLGIVKMEQGSFSEALAIFEQQRKKAIVQGNWQRATTCLHEIGQVYLITGRTDESRTALEQCLKEKLAYFPDETHTDTRFLLSRVLSISGDVPTAYAMIKT